MPLTDDTVFDCDALLRRAVRAEHDADRLRRDNAALRAERDRLLVRVGAGGPDSTRTPRVAA